MNDLSSLQAQLDQHAEELAHLKQQCSDLKQHLRDSADESGRQAKGVKSLEAKLRQSLAAQGDRDSEIAQLKEAAAARSNLDSSAAQVLMASCTCQSVSRHAWASNFIVHVPATCASAASCRGNAWAAPMPGLRAMPALHRLLIRYMVALSAGTCCSCRGRCQSSRQAAGGDPGKGAEGCPGGPGCPTAGAGSWSPARADQVCDECLSLNVATSGGMCDLAGWNKVGMWRLPAAVGRFCCHAAAALSIYCSHPGCHVCGFVYAHACMHVLAFFASHSVFAEGVEVWPWLQVPHKAVETLHQSVLYNMCHLLFLYSLPAGQRMSSVSSALPPFTVCLPRRSRA